MSWHDVGVGHSAWACKYCATSES